MKSYVALCSALVFVLSAAIGPFTQQTIRTFACELPSHNDSASVPIAEYLSYHTDIGTYRVGTSRVAAQVSPQMSIAVLEGIVGSLDQANDIPVSCRTGNCDFHGDDEGPISYSSLAICSSCEDISDHIMAEHIVDEDHADYSWSYNFSDTNPSYLAIRDGSDTSFIFKDGSYPFLNIQAPNKEGFGSRADYTPSTNITFMSFTWANCSLPATYSDSWDWYDKVDCASYSRFPGLQNKVGLVAANCSLHICVRNYASNVRNGKLEEKTVSINKDMIAVNESATIVVDDITKVSDVSYRLIKDPCFLDGQKYITTNLSQAPHSPGRIFTTLLIEDEPVDVPLECTFGIDKHFSWGIFQYLHDIFQSTCRVDDWGPDGDWIVCFDAWWYKPLFNQGNASLDSISAAFEKLSLAITARMRTTGMNAYNTESGRVVGTVTRPAVCIQVYWPWLTLHMFLVLWTGLIFALVLYDSRRLRDIQPIWKHSSLVPFFHTLRYDEQQNGSIMRKPAPVERGSMDEAASKMVVKLQHLHEGYVFVVEEGSEKSVLRTLEPASMRQSSDTESPDVLAEPDFGPHFSTSVDESLEEAG